MNQQQEPVKNVKEAIYSWPPSPSLPVSSTIAQEQRHWQIPPIQGIAEQLMHQAVANGGPMPPNMYLPAFSVNLPQSVPEDPKMIPQMWQQFGPSSLPSSPLPPPENPNKPYLGHYQLSPLSNGGFLYGPNIGMPSSPQGFLVPPSQNQPAPPRGPTSRHYSYSIPQPSPQQISQIEDEITIKPSMVAQTRTEKIEKYRNKRSSRNWNRQSDPSKKAAAQSRPRDVTGQFVSETKDPVRFAALQEVMKQLEMTQKESKLLNQRLSAMEQELAQLRDHAIESRINEEKARQALEFQQSLNRDLMTENQFLWQTVPQDEIFTTLNPDHPYVDREPFFSKIDLSEIENSLVLTDSPSLGREEWPKQLAETPFFPTSNS